MGNSSALAYDVTTPIEYNNGIVAWSIDNASKQNVNNENEIKDNFCIFRVQLNTNKQQQLQSNEYILAQKGIQRLKLLKHPYVLKFIENTEINDSIVLITETVIPLETWLNNVSNTQTNVQLQEILWGLKCILLALHFLHNNCNIIHGNIGLHSIFVTPSGDWKLGSMELAGNMSERPDIDHFLKYHHLLLSMYSSPERLASSSLNEILQTTSSSNNNPVLVPFYFDIYSFGQVTQKVFNKSNIEIPRAFNKYITSMLQQDFKKRPTSNKLCQSSMFNSQDMQFIENIGELSLKSPKEFLEVISKMEDKINVLSKSVCAYKILPNISRSLQIAINDFPIRDAREISRQSVQVSISLLTKLSLNDKIDQYAFRMSCVPVIVQLWAMTDRSVRTAMLQSLKALIPFIPEIVINKTIFDQMMAGFSDSNSKLREATLMNLIYVVDKLEEMQLQDKLVRCITNLQNDVEPSIRTNSTIFLGKIAGKLKEAVRARVLCSAFQKAMKDNFLHCRIAGLKTSNACIKLLDPAQLVTKIIPQASINALDKSHEIRILSLTLLDSCITILKNYNVEIVLKSKSDPTVKDHIITSPLVKPPTSTSDVIEASISDTTPVSWTSWSMLQGISKSLESATIVHSTIEKINNSSNAIYIDKNIDVISQKSSGSNMDEMNYNGFLQQEGQGQHSIVVESGWDDELDELNLDETEDIDDNDDSGNKINHIISTGSCSINRYTNHRSRNSSINTVVTNKDVTTLDSSSPVASQKKSAKVKVMVKKLDVSREEDTWDDF